jgi:hypothetical protein
MQHHIEKEEEDNNPTCDISVAGDQTGQKLNIIKN